MWDVVSFFSLPPSSGMSESPAVCIARVLLLPSVGTWSLVQHGFCTSWTVFKTYCVTCFLLALVAPFSRGCVSALLGEYVPFFPQGFFFLGFSYQADAPQISASPSHARGIVYDLLKYSSRVAGLPYQSRKRHSFCIGAASVAAAASLPDWLIKVSQPLVLGLLPAVYQNSSIYISLWLPGWLFFLDTSSQSTMRDKSEIFTLLKLFSVGIPLKFIKSCICGRVSASVFSL